MSTMASRKFHVGCLVREPNGQLVTLADVVGGAVPFNDRILEAWLGLAQFARQGR